jgi:flagellar hook-associated protein 2
VRIGFDSASGKDLSQSIAAMLTSNGLIYERVQIETQTQRDLQERKVALEEKLVTVEQRYRSQYAALDALLYQLNSTSESLKSALDSLTASQQND